MPTLLIDNYDSFTWNLYQYLAEVNGQEPQVVPNDHDWRDIDWSAVDNIVVSPGPGRPDRPRDFGISKRAITSSGLPVLGVCLGFQGLCQLFGGRVVAAREPLHGRVRPVHHRGTDLFEGIPSPFAAVRYHSLVVANLPPELEQLAWDPEGVVMAVRHRSRPLWGVQFHPESILTEHGHELLANFGRLSAADTRQPGLRPAVDRPGRAAAPGRAAPDGPGPAIADVPGPAVADVPGPAVADLPDARTVRAHAGSGPEPTLRLHVRRIEHAPEPAEVHQRLYAAAPTSFWLDGSDPRHPLGRFSFMGDDSGPLAEQLVYDVTAGLVSTHRHGRPAEVARMPLVDHLDRQLRRRAVAVPADLPFEFTLGYVGYLGYEVKADTGARGAHRAAGPDAELIFADRMLAFDSISGDCWLLCLSDGRPGSDDQVARSWLAELTAALTTPGWTQGWVPGMGRNPTGPGPSPAVIRFRHDRRAYLDRIDTALRYLREGETYEICLTNTATTAAPVDVGMAYQRLRQVSPVPFAALLRFGDTSILGASPERFLSVTASGMVESRPIKGTRARTADPQEDRRRATELAGNEKDRAENLMVVDLVRNDLNRVCQVGSVEVRTLFAVESYPQVHHLVSVITGRLRPEASALDCLRAAFPGGSMTGAPKLRTMELLDDLEGEARGVYSGCLGWFGLSGAVDLSIVIRTVVVAGSTASFGVGGAIVALSDPADEWDETQVKARAMLAALGHPADPNHSAAADQPPGPGHPVSD
jgi:para-aminobenzoate synthetase